MAKALDSKGSSRLSKGVDKLLSGFVSPEDFAKYLFDLNLERARATDPKLAKVMRACAIPRRFDAKTIGVLRHAPKDYKTNKRLLEALKTFQFVQVRKDGDYVYHDNTRDAVLKDWQSDKNRSEYERLKRWLVTFYKTTAEKQFDKKEYATALANLYLAIELQPKDGELQYLLGTTHYELRDYSAALVDFTEAVQLQPGEWEPLYWRGATKFQLMDYQAAKDDLTQAIKLQPEEDRQGKVYSLRASTYHQLKNYQAARADFAKAVKLDPENANNYLSRAINHFHLQNYRAALSDLKTAIKLQPRDSLGYYWRGAVYYEYQDYEAAIADLTKAIELNPKDGKNYTGRGINYFQLLNYKAALKDTKKAIKLEPEHSHNYNLRGMIYYRLRDYAAALTDFEKAISLHQDPVYYLGRGTCLLSLGKLSGALDAFNGCVNLDSSKPQPFFWRGIASQLSGDKKRAKADWNQASKLAKGERDPCVRQRISARLELISGKVKVARKKYSRILTRFCKVADLQAELSHLVQLEALFSSRKEIRTIREWFEAQLRLKA